MGKDSRIEWTHHTFNPWWGCVKVSPACDHCYAESWAKRVGSDVWGAEAPRRFFSDTHWKEPLKWNRDAIRQPPFACRSHRRRRGDTPSASDAKLLSELYLTRRVSTSGFLLMGVKCTIMIMRIVRICNLCTRFLSDIAIWQGRSLTRVSERREAARHLQRCSVAWSDGTCLSACGLVAPSVVKGGPVKPSTGERSRMIRHEIEWKLLMHP